MLADIGALDAAFAKLDLDVGARSVLARNGELIDRARSTIDFEALEITDPVTAGKYRDALERGVVVRGHLDQEYLPHNVIGAGDGVIVTDHGADPHKLHTKLTVIDEGLAAYVKTTAPELARLKDDSLDFGAVLGAEHASVLLRMTRAAQSGDPVEIAASAEAGARLGVYLLDAPHGVHLAPQRLMHAIGTASSSIYAAPKIIDDKPLLGLLAERSRDVRVMVDSGDQTPGKLAKKWREKGLDIARTDDGKHATHGNATIVDDRLLLFGTGPYSDRGMGRESANRMARELLVATTDRSAIDRAWAGFDQVPGSRSAAFRATIRGEA